MKQKKSQWSALNKTIYRFKDFIYRHQAFLLLSAIVMLGLSLRLYHITYPYLDHHSWRQSETAMIARNLYREGFNIFRPEMDFNAGKGIIEVELQITTLFTAILYWLFGITDMIGRIVPILFSLAAIVYLYKLAKLFFDKTVALFASFMYAILPLNVFFSRVLMPESGMLFFTIASVYYFASYLRKEDTRNYILAFIFTFLALVSKQPNLFILLVPLAYMAFEKYRFRWNPKIILLLVVSVALSAGYYFYIHSIADVKVIGDFGTGAWGNLSLWTQPDFYNVIITRFFTVIFTQVGIFLFTAGIFLNKKRAIDAWLIAVIIYIFAVGTNNFWHSYYQLPVMPAGAIYIGLALDYIFRNKSKILGISLCIVVFSLAVFNVLPLYREYAIHAFDAAKRLDEIDKENSLILTAVNRNDMGPEILYNADRKGWIIYPESLSIDSIEEYRSQGAKYLVVLLPQSFTSEVQSYISSRTIVEADDYLIAKV